SAGARRQDDSRSPASYSYRSAIVSVDRRRPQEAVRVHERGRLPRSACVEGVRAGLPRGDRDVPRRNHGCSSGRAYPGPLVQGSAALADRFKAGDIPDINLLPDRTRVLVRKELVDAKLTLTADALPNLPATTFEIISLQEAETLARRTGRDVVYLAVDNPHIDGDAATISLGIDVATHSNAGVVKMCCCTGRAEYRKRAGTWVFVKWRE